VRKTFVKHPDENRVEVENEKEHTLERKIDQFED
jgi:hypothetical protein